MLTMRLGSAFPVYLTNYLVFLCSILNVVFAGDRWDGLTRFTTINGQGCVTPCAKRGQSYNWCYVEDRTWQYCSPGINVDYKGERCIGNHPCDNHGYSYTWCYTTPWKHWDYCGKTLPSPDPIPVYRYKTRYGDHCVTPCGKTGGSSYNWCRIPGGSWDYCSADPGYDVYGKTCKNTCDKHGDTSYTWCDLEEGSWGYCGDVSVSTETEYTYQDSKCVTPCSYKGDGDSNQCIDASDRELACSMAANMSTNNKECTSECNRKAGSDKDKYFNWCWTKRDKSEWSYCGIVRDDPKESRSIVPRGWNRREYFPLDGIELRLTRTGSRENIYMHRDDQAINSVTFYEFLERTGLNANFPMNDDLWDWGLACLDNWRDRGYRLLPRGSRESRLAEAGEIGNVERRGVRLDQQERYYRNGIEYVNLQLQVNGITRDTNGGRSTSIGEAQVPVAVVESSPRRVVGALINSMHRRGGIHIASFNYDPPTRRRGGGNH